MDILAVVIFIVLYLVGLAGVILPVLPGTPLIAVGAVIYGFMTGFARMSVESVVWIVVLALLAQGVDHLAGIIGARRFGASRSGVWGGVIGSILGLLWFPPFGFLLGAIFGAVLVELLERRTVAEAVRSGLGTLLGTLGGVLAKVLIVITIGIIAFPKIF